MRALAVVALLLFAVVAVTGPAAAPHLPNHLVPITGTLAAGESRTVSSLSFEDAPLIGGWVFLLQAQTSGPLEAQLWIGALARNWTIPASTSWYATTILPADGYYNLTLRNPGSGSVTFSLYYDQSCNCVSKQFPVDLVARRLYVPSGYVMFNTDASKPSTVATEFTKPSALTLRITAATLAQAGGVWPDDFVVLGTTETPVQRQAGPGVPPVWLYDLSVTVPQAARVYYFVQAVSLVAANVSQYATIVSFNPTVTPTPQLPLVPIVLLAAAVTLAVVGGVVLWRGRTRTAPERDASKGRPKGRGKGARKRSRRRGGAHGGARTRTSRARRRRS